MIPVNKNEEYIIDIDSISSEGNGVGRIQGFTVFVPDTCPRDKVKIRITHVKSRFAYGEAAELSEPSELRCDAKCPHVSECGGCQLRHIQYEAQLSEKKKIVENNLRRIGGFKDFSLDRIIGAANPERYRNKALFRLEKSPDGVISGFYSRKSHRAAAISDCLICGRDFSKIAAAIAAYSEKYNIHTAIDSIFIRESHATGEIMTVIYSSLKKLIHEEEIVSRILSACSRVTSILLDCGKTRALYGSKEITEEINGIKFKVSHESFLQVNPVQTEILYKTALDYADIKDTDRVMDIYCGIGTISLCAAKSAKSVTGIEKVERAILDARENAALNNITNANFYAGSAEDIVPSLIEKNTDIVILDPPRAGSDEKTLSAILAAATKRIIYISCNSASLARDLKFICAHGWKITHSAACDMFPHTMHTETVICLEPDSNIA